MSVAVQARPRPADPAVLSPPRPHRFTVEQYHRMIELGVFGEHDRVELIEGLILDKMTHNPPHDAAVQLVQTELLRLLPAEWVLRVQSAVTLSDSEPEPDLVVARAPIRRYSQSHPRPRDIALIAEVADSSLAEDRGRMAAVYARARIPVYWIVNLVDRQVEVHGGPRSGRAPAYRDRHEYGSDAAVPVVLGGRQVGTVPVRELLP